MTTAVTTCATCGDTRALGELHPFPGVLVPEVPLRSVCMQCVANAAPYVGVAVGGLRAMSWRATRLRQRATCSPSTDTHHGLPVVEPERS